MSLHDLPNEILLQILQLLSYNDLKIVSQTSKRFYIVATDPNLWRDFTSARKSISLKIGMLRMPRFQNLKFVNFSNTFEDSNKNRLVKKNRRRITPKCQITAIFELLANMKVEEIHFEKFNFKNFNNQLYFDVVLKTMTVRLEEVHHKSFEKNQLLKLLEGIPGSGIKNLEISLVHLWDVEPVKVAVAINSLESLSMESCPCLPAVQLFEVFSEMSVRTCLRKVYIGVPLNPLFNATIQSVPSDVLALAVTKLEEFIAPRMRFSPDQIKSVLEAVSMNSSKIKKIDLGSAFAPDLKNIDMVIRRKVIKKIERNDFKLHMVVKNIEGRVGAFREMEEGRGIRDML